MTATQSTTAVACALFCIAAASLASGQQHFPGQDLRDLLASQKSASEITIPPGVYDFTNAQSGGLASHLVLNGHRNQVIHAQNVIINATLCGQILSIVRFHLCSNVTIEGMAVDCDPLVGTQGTIISVAGDYRSVDVAIDPGYRTDIFSTSHSGSPALRPPKVYTPDGSDFVLGCATFNVLSGQVQHVGSNSSHWRIGVAQVGMSCLQAGQKLALVATTHHGIWVTASSNIVFDGTRVWSAGAMGFAMSGGFGNHKLKGVRVERRPGTDRLWSSNRDGIHNSEMHVGAVLEDSYVGWNMDDGINQHGFYGFLIEESINSNSFTYVGHTVNHDPQTLFGTGAAVRYSLQGPRGTDGNVLAEVSATAISREDNQPGFNASLLNYAVSQDWCAPLAQCRAWRVSTSTRVTLPIGAAVFTQDIACRGGRVHRNVFDHNDGRCVLLQWPSGIIQDNTCLSPILAGVVVNGQVYGTGPVEDTVVRGNMVIKSGMINAQPGVGWSYVGNGHGIMAQFDNAPSGFTNYAWMNRRMTIENNIISEPLNSGIYVYTAMDAIVQSNQVCSLGSRAGPYSGVPQSAVVIGGSLGSPDVINATESGTTTENQPCGALLTTGLASSTSSGSTSTTSTASQSTTGSSTVGGVATGTATDSSSASRRVSSMIIIAECVALLVLASL